jgi:hypothetical protein
MGVSTDAILFYGYCWDDEDMHNPWQSPDGDDEDDDGGDDGWEERYARAKGCLPPETPYPERTVTPTRENGWNSTPKDYSKAEQAIIDKHRAYWDAKGKIADASPCLVDRHCMASCPMAYVAVKKSVTTSNRGCPSEITSLTIDPAWNAQLAEFCETLGIKTKGKKVGWWLVSDWSE